MAQAATPVTGELEVGRAGGWATTLVRILRYTLTRAVALFVTVVIGVYLTIVIANMGGYVDRIREAEIRFTIGEFVRQDPQLRRLSPQELQQFVEGLVQVEMQRLGMDRPFIVRSFGYLRDALLLNLGRAERLTSNTGSRQVRLIILERLAPTLLLFGTSNILLFFASLFIALSLSRRYGSPLDRAVVALAPTSAAPPWLYGLFLIFIFASILKVLPFGGMVEAPPPPTTLGYTLSLLKHLILPSAAIFLSSVFATIYSWRTFFLIYSSEDYVEMARAKGLSARAIERRYVLRPTLPTIVTSFLLTVISLWTGAILTETVFNWPGLGRLFYAAIGVFDTPVIVGETVIYAYLLALTVFLLDIIYALVDPRVKVGFEGSGQ